MRFLLIACLGLAPLLHADETSLRRDLERTFSLWRTAIATRNLAAWKQSTAASRQMMTRNIIVSQRQPFPQALFDFPLRAPETATLHFIKATEKGPTANMIYFGKVDLGIPDTEVPENLLLLKFINEAGQWKFDTLRMVNLANVPEVREALKNGSSTGLLAEPEFEPDGLAPETPKPCPTPDYVAALEIASYGYATKARVNGYELPLVADSQEQHLIIGGLRDGENSLSLEINPTPVAQGSARQIEVSAVVMSGQPNKPMLQVFDWKPEGSVPANSEQKIFVNKITLRSGN